MAFCLSCSDGDPFPFPFPFMTEVDELWRLLSRVVEESSDLGEMVRKLRSPKKKRWVVSYIELSCIEEELEEGKRSVDVM